MGHFNCAHRLDTSTDDSVGVPEHMEGSMDDSVGICERIKGSIDDSVGIRERIEGSKGDSVGIRAHLCMFEARLRLRFTKGGGVWRNGAPKQGSVSPKGGGVGEILPPGKVIKI